MLGTKKRCACRIFVGVFDTASRRPAVMIRGRFHVTGPQERMGAGRNGGKRNECWNEGFSACRNREKKILMFVSIFFW